MPTPWPKPSKIDRLLSKDASRLLRTKQRRAASIAKHRQYGGSDWAAAKARIAKRDGGHCLLCGMPTNAPPHHITKVAAGGTNADNNLISLDPICHALADERRISAAELRALLSEKYGYRYPELEGLSA